jgi:hypothetical protein
MYNLASCRCLARLWAQNRGEVSNDGFPMVDRVDEGRNWVAAKASGVEVTSKAIDKGCSKPESRTDGG